MLEGILVKCCMRWNIENVLSKGNKIFQRFSSTLVLDRDHIIVPCSGTIIPSTVGKTLFTFVNSWLKEKFMWLSSGGEVECFFSYFTPQDSVQWEEENSEVYTRHGDELLAITSPKASTALHKSYCHSHIATNSSLHYR